MLIELGLFANLLVWPVLLWLVIERSARQQTELLDRFEHLLRMVLVQRSADPQQAALAQQLLESDGLEPGASEPEKPPVTGVTLSDGTEVDFLTALDQGLVQDLEESKIQRGKA